MEIGIGAVDGEFINEVEGYQTKYGHPDGQAEDLYQALYPVSIQVTQGGY